MEGGRCGRRVEAEARSPAVTGFFLGGKTVVTSMMPSHGGREWICEVVTIQRRGDGWARERRGWVFT